VGGRLAAGGGTRTSRPSPSRAGGPCGSRWRCRRRLRRSLRPCRRGRLCTAVPSASGVFFRLRWVAFSSSSRCGVALVLLRFPRSALRVSAITPLRRLRRPLRLRGALGAGRCARTDWGGPAEGLRAAASGPSLRCKPASSAGRDAAAGSRGHQRRRGAVGGLSLFVGTSDVGWLRVVGSRGQ